MKPLDLLQVDLSGSHLLEAGAGTGKTYSLSFLYLRLLLEKGLKVEEIVVATFTTAATAELKERIYARLFEAENILSTKAINPVDVDATLQQWLNQQRDNVGEKLLLQRLRLAQAQFDRAQIHSINGFALQLLSEHAATLGQTVPETILDDDSELIKNIYLQLAQDNFADLGPAAKAVGTTLATFKSADLFALLSKMHSHYEQLKHAETLLPNVLAASTAFEQAVDSLNAKHHRQAIDAIQAAVENAYLHKSHYTLEKLDHQAKQLADKSAYHANNIDFFNFFSRRQLLEKRVAAGKKADVGFDDALFLTFERLGELAPILAKKEKIESYQHLMLLLSVISQRLDKEKAEQMALSHDDIVQIVADKADKLQLPLKAALLDEAQDTNKSQLVLFKKLFLQRGLTCFFVGDPKQAIYGFRGGDVYTYLAIAQEVKQRHLLPKNYRSTQALNDSINTLFQAVEFSPKEENDTCRIDYHAIDWDKPNSDSDFAKTALMRVSAESNADLADTAADYLIDLLNKGYQIKDGNNHRQLQSGDIAVLVRSGGQAKRVQTALAERGVSASYTGQDSVYGSDEAILMLALLQAIGSGKSQQIKALMLSPLLAYQPSQLLDEACVNSLCQQLRDDAACYRQRGFAVMFYRFMHQHHVGGRLLQFADGKRRLSNWIQLFELLQTALQKQALPLLGLAEWLLRKINEHDKESQLRLEDQNAITITTMHKAKGLEFKVVCLPFFHYHRKRGGNTEELLVSHRHDLAALKSLDIQTINDYCQAEQTAENRRLAYVALTRATYQNIIIEQPVPKKTNATRSNSIWQYLLDTLKTPISDFAFTQHQDRPMPQQVEPLSAKPEALTRTLTKRLLPKWKLTSFSALLAQMSNDNHQSTVKIKTASDHPTLSALMQFPPGPKAGVVLHTLYEYYMANRCLDNDFIAYVKSTLKQSQLPACPPPAAVAAAIAKTAEIPLSPQRFCLNDINVGEQSIEMAFFLHLSPLARQHLYHCFGEQIKPLIDGYLHGFIDYCFAYEQRFYVLDYKSNQLGQRLEDYHGNAMQAAMDEHRYDLQALIYTLALCKHLGINNSQDYQQLIGGYYYLFIRGMSLPDKNKNNNALPHVVPADNGIYFRRIDWDLLAPLLT